MYLLIAQLNEMSSLMNNLVEIRPYQQEIVNQYEKLTTKHKSRIIEFLKEEFPEEFI